MKDAPDIVSPLTGKHGVKVFDTILSRDIIAAYYHSSKIDISGFFKDVPVIYVMECVATGYRFYYPYSVVGGGDIYNLLHQAYPDKTDWYRKEGYDYQFAYDRIPAGVKLLDIGCGTGEFLKKIKEKTTDVTGLELNNHGFRECEKAGLTVYQQTIQEHSEGREEFYDVVCFFQVLEHIYDVKSFLQAAVKVLKKGGYLFIGVPNNEPYLRRFDKYNTYNLPPHHMGLWNKKSLSSLQSLFNLGMQEVGYDEKIKRWDIDAYLRARMWLNIKTEYHHHTIGEKVKMALLSPVAAPMSLAYYLKHGSINGSFIVANFIKAQ